jgi:hypothetical protein
MRRERERAVGLHAQALLLDPASQRFQRTRGKGAQPIADLQPSLLFVLPRPMLLLFLLRRIHGADPGRVALRALDAVDAAVDRAAEPVLDPALVEPVEHGADDGEGDDQLTPEPMIRWASCKRRNYCCARTAASSGGCWAK